MRNWGLLGLAGCVLTTAVWGYEDVYLTGVPDYQWEYGCFGTACGNLMGYWDRHGLPDFYTGPTAGGVAPLTSYSWQGHGGIIALWASKAGLDGRPSNQPGHVDDYWVSYESSAPDPYVTLGRKEHAWDCIGDFIGLSQRKWTNLGGECDGNLDAYTFTYWDSSGARRVNFTPTPAAGLPAIDLQSGLRAWAEYRGYGADTFTQLCEFDPDITTPGAGFTYEDLKAEIKAGFPVLVHLQDPGKKSQSIGNMPRANPPIHGMLAYGYYELDDGRKFVRTRESWATGDTLHEWNNQSWTPSLPDFLPIRGLIGFHPRPRITAVERVSGGIKVRWEGPEAELYYAATDTRRQVHRYVVERSTSLEDLNFVAASEPTQAREITLPDCCPGGALYRVTLLPPE